MSLLSFHLGGGAEGTTLTNETGSVFSAFLRVFIQKSGWTLPALYKLLNELRELATLVRNLCPHGLDISSRYS